MHRNAVPNLDRFFRIGIAAALILWSAYGSTCPLELPQTDIAVKGHPLRIEIAASARTRNCGLSRRSHLPQGQGMLFVFPRPEPLTFWMKDTYIPLSIAFLDDEGRILNIEQMRPIQTREVYHSSGPSRYALEVNEGWFERHGIRAGDWVELPEAVSREP